MSELLEILKNTIIDFFTAVTFKNKFYVLNDGAQNEAFDFAANAW
jgi:hypothetical protein